MQSSADLWAKLAAVWPPMTALLATGLVLLDIADFKILLLSSLRFSSFALIIFFSFDHKVD